MSTGQQVHWHEGLFLQPHHLQVMQRQVLDRIAGERRLSWSYPYGVIDLEISDAALQNARIEVQRIHAVMRSGVEVTYPGFADLAPLDITRALEMGSGTMTISLAVPQWQERRANASADGDGRPSDSLYRVYEVPVFDENTGTNAQPVQVRRVNARLLIDADEASAPGFDTLPLLRIKRAAGEAVGKPVRDHRFIPPCLTLEGSTELRRIILGIAESVEATRRELLPEMTREGFNYEMLKGNQYGLLLKLRTLNRFAGKLRAMGNAQGITPFLMYLELRELLGELVALEPDKDELFDVPDYRHEEPGVIFHDLSERILRLLVRVVKQTVMTVSFEDRAGVPTAALTDEHLTVPNDYFLGVVTGGNPNALEQLVLDPDHFKVMARSMIQRAIRGIRLTVERHPPSGLPRQDGLYYFRLDRTPASKTRWDEIRSDPEKAMAIKRPPGEFPDARYTLYMTIPSAR